MLNSLCPQTHPRAANYANSHLACCEINKFAATAETDCLISFVYQKKKKTTDSKREFVWEHWNGGGFY